MVYWQLKELRWNGVIMNKEAKAILAKNLHIKDSEDCGIIEAMKTLENKALMRFYRKELTLSS
ncbi:MAG: hypothetical protein NTW44_03800 [Nitrospirae bacterium]|nr:hypothetical protein [Nitrospirota bacterium]